MRQKVTQFEYYIEELVKTSKKGDIGSVNEERE